MVVAGGVMAGEEVVYVLSVCYFGVVWQGYSRRSLRMGKEGDCSVRLHGWGCGRLWADDTLIEDGLYIRGR